LRRPRGLHARRFGSGSVALHAPARPETAVVATGSQRTFGWHEAVSGIGLSVPMALLGSIVSVRFEPSSAAVALTILVVNARSLLFEEGA